MKRLPHILMVCPSTRLFYRAKGEVRCRAGSVIPRLAEKGFQVNVLIPHDPTLLPKTKLTPNRTFHPVLKLAQNYPVEITKLTRGSVSPGIYMVNISSGDPAVSGALFAKAALALAEEIRRPVDIFHFFDWKTALLPLFMELEKNGSRVLKDSRTFFNVTSLREQGNFGPAVLRHLGVPDALFHPNGIEFYGKVSYLKAGLLFSDSVGIVDESTTLRRLNRSNANGLEGVLDAMAFKLRRWASERSVKAHLDAYAELLSLPKPKPLLPQLLERVHATKTEAKKFMENWGPVPPERYGTNNLSFLLQSPNKTYAFWEWSGPSYSDLGLVLENHSTGSRQILSRGLSPLGEYWIHVEPDGEYLVELVGWNNQGFMTPLLRSRVLRTPRIRPSSNKNAYFVDVRTRRRFSVKGGAAWDDLMAGMRWGGTSALEWSAAEMPSSYPLSKK